MGLFLSFSLNLSDMAATTLILHHASQCEVSAGAVDDGWRRPGAGRKEKALGKERGGAGQAREGSPVAREVDRQKSLQEGGLPLFVKSQGLKLQCDFPPSSDSLYSFTK